MFSTSHRSAPLPHCHQLHAPSNSAKSLKEPQEALQILSAVIIHVRKEILRTLICPPRSDEKRSAGQAQTCTEVTCGVYRELVGAGAKILLAAMRLFARGLIGKALAQVNLQLRVSSGGDERD